MGANFIPLVLLGLVIEATLLQIRGLGNLQHHVVGAITLLLATSVFYLISVWAILRTPETEEPTAPVSGCRTTRLGFILVAAAAFRLTLWPLFPAFSQDPFRYRWEGKLQSKGGNPYQVRPNDAPWAGIRDETFSRVVLPDFKSIYGPLTELLEWGTYEAISRTVGDPFGQVFWFKLPGALFDLGVVGALYALLRRNGLPPERLLIYAWCPLPVFEFWATGHNDSIAVFFLVAALAVLRSGRGTSSAGLLGLATAAKLWPALLLPLFLREAKPTAWVRLTAAWLAPIIVLAWPYRSNVTENIRFTSGFLGGWRNNDLLYGFLLARLGEADRAKHAAFAILALVLVLVAILRPALERGVLAAITAMLAISANVHPWYLTWFLPLLALTPVTPLLLWTALMPLTYSVLIDWFSSGEWQGSTAIRWYVYIPVLAMALKTSIPSGGWRSRIRKGTHL